jgi:hypothetical protein
MKPSSMRLQSNYMALLFSNINPTYTSLEIVNGPYNEIGTLHISVKFDSNYESRVNSTINTFI